MTSADHGAPGSLTAGSAGLASHSLRNGSEIKGSDSGISMTSQDVQDMFDLLQQQLPFDMPKLRRKMVSANRLVPNLEQNALLIRNVLSTKSIGI